MNTPTWNRANALHLLARLPQYYNRAERQRAERQKSRGQQGQKGLQSYDLEYSVNARRGHHGILPVENVTVKPDEGRIYHCLKIPVVRAVGRLSQQNTT